MSNENKSMLDVLNSSDLIKLAKYEAQSLRKDANFTMLPLLFLLRVKDGPYTLKNHWMMEPMFNMALPPEALWKCARQVGKSQNLAASRVLRSIIINGYHMLFVCPRFEQTKRLSTDYVKPLVISSLFKEFLVDSNSDQSVLHKTFANGSVHHYSFAFLDAERIRGVSVAEIGIDEVQDINWEFIPVIAECLSGSEFWRNQIYTGTPKGWDNTIQKLWDRSSRAEWTTKCLACNHWNIACIEEDILGMIGPETVVCAKCKRPIDPHLNGGWVHRSPELRPDFVGYHIPQVTHPFHYSKPKFWKKLLYKKEAWPKVKFYNECLGESCDSATRLMSIDIMKKISIESQPNTLDAALKLRKQYRLVSMGIDWGGGGEDSKSFTAVAIGGVRGTGDVVETIYLLKLNRSMLPEEEVRDILLLYKKFKPDLVAHDYGGAGNIRETLLIQAGIPPNKLIPFTYVFSATKNIINYNKAKQGSRASYSIDKAKSLAVLCAMMKARKVLLPNYETSKDCVEAFLNLVEDIQERPRGSDVYLIGKAPDTSDDIAHAMNYMASCIWYTNQRYPDLLSALHLGLSVKDMESLDPRVKPLDPRINNTYSRKDIKDINPGAGQEDWGE